MSLSVIYSRNDDPTGAARVLYDTRAKHSYHKTQTEFANSTTRIVNKTEFCEMVNLHGGGGGGGWRCVCVRALRKQTPQTFRFIGNVWFHLRGHANSQNITFKLINAHSIIKSC
jgi:hypothetical protein